MSRMIKLVPLAVVPVLALAAFGASAAQAAEYGATSFPTTVKVETTAKNETIRTAAGALECHANYEATLSGSSRTLTVTPSYSGCQWFGFQNVELKMNGCAYHFNEPIGTSPNFYATANIVCPSGKLVEYKAGTCLATVGPQALGGSIALKNNAGPPKFVTEQLSLTGLAYTVTRDGLLCPFGGTGPKTGGTLTQAGPEAMTATNGAGFLIG
jgi:hypothetical protein